VMSDVSKYQKSLETINFCEHKKGVVACFTVHVMFSKERGISNMTRNAVFPHTNNSYPITLHDMSCSLVPGISVCLWLRTEGKSRNTFFAPHFSPCMNQSLFHIAK
jgi:hypothetical protein